MKEGTINVSVSSHYGEPSCASEVTSQGILGERFIHSSGWVRINSLKETDGDFSDHHLRTFISVNRYTAQGL